MNNHSGSGPGGYRTQSEGSDKTRNRILAPFGKNFNYPPNESVNILTGSGAWEIAKIQRNSPRPKLLLPFGEDPSKRIWPVRKRDCLIFSFGEAESKKKIFNLSSELMKAGANFVLICTNLNRSTMITRSNNRRTAA